MKKIVLAIIGTFLMSMPSMAQDQQPQNGQRQRPTKEQMVKMRTDRVVEKYGLDANQAQQLLALNTKYADLMAPKGGPRGGHRGGMRPPRQGGQQQAKPRPERPDSVGSHPRQLPKELQEYDAALQQILTSEQYKAYKADQEKQRKAGQRGRRQQQ